ncbi:hypothetical protein HOY80DRAFT_978246 [Tuber brumale]|nr:hypothetical protein HOY80DRAFT_978246 [Tuber brumale]
MGSNQKANIKDSNEEGGRGEYEPNFGERASIVLEEVESPKTGHGGVEYGVGDEEFSKPPLPSSTVQPPGEKGPAGRDTDTPGTKGVLGAAAGLQSGGISVDIGGIGSPLAPETKERKTVRLQPEEIRGVGIGDGQGPAMRGMSAEGDGAIGDSKVSDQKGGEDEAVEAEGGAEGPTETEEVLEYSGGVKGAPKADEEGVSLSTRVLDREKNTRGRDSGLSPQHLPEIKETSPGAMAREASSVDLKSTDIGHNGGATKGHDGAINIKQHDKPPAKRVSFAPEPSGSSSREGSTGSEAKKLEKISDVPAEPGYNLETPKGHDIPTDEKQHDQPAEIKFKPAQKHGNPSGTKELWKVADVLGEFGPDIGPIRDHDRIIDEKQQNQPVGKEPHPAHQSRLNPETEELEKVADVVGEFGYNVGIIKGHDRAIDNRHHDKLAPNNAHAPDSPASESQLPYVGAERAPKPPDLGNIPIESGEFRYNVGGQSRFDPGGHKTHGADTRGSGTSAGISEGQKPDDTSAKTPATNGTAESLELGNITIETGDFGYNIGGLPSSHPDRHKAHRRRPSRPFQGGDGTEPEVEELDQITMESGEFGYPSSRPGRHRQHSHGKPQDQADQKTSESGGLDQTKPINGEFGFSIGDPEHLQRGKVGEGPTASGSIHRNKQPTNEGPSHTSNIRDSVHHRSPDEGDNRSTHTKESQQQSLLSECAPGGTTTNDTPQSHPHGFTSESSCRPVSSPQPVHATEVIEPEKPSSPQGQQSQATTTYELRTLPTDPGSDLTSGITAESWLQKVESDLDNIHKHLSHTPQVETDKHHSNADAEAKFVKVEVHPHPKEVRSREGGMGKLVVWGVLGVGVITALVFAALWGGFSHPAIGFGLREGEDWSDKLAEWLFKEGKKGSS